MNDWVKHLGIEYPQCKMTGRCCRMATPSTPAIKLLEKAAKGSTTARDFFAIFQPYESIEEVRNLCAELVERSIKAIEKLPAFDSVDQLVFYHCKYIGDDNKCLIHEDRPQLCRDFPDTPYLIMPPGCAFESWAKECKEKYQQMKNELQTLKEIKKTLKDADELTAKGGLKMFLVSPGSSWIK